MVRQNPLRQMPIQNLSNNYNMALNCLKNTEKRLIKQPELGNKYCEIIQQYMDK